MRSRHFVTFKIGDRSDGLGHVELRKVLLTVPNKAIDDIIAGLLVGALVSIEVDDLNSALALERSLLFVSGIQLTGIVIRAETTATELTE